MNNKEKVGGRAYSNGVRLKNKHKSVKAYYDNNGNIRIQTKLVKQNKFIEQIKKVPLIRGIAVIIFAILSFLKEVFKEPKKYWFVFLILMAEVLYMFLPSDSSSAIQGIVFLIYISIPIILLFVFKNSVSEVLKFHGAEHKAVNYYENDYQGDIASYSRIHRRCGSNIVFFYIIISILAGFFELGLPLILQEILILGIAYEAIKYLPEKLLGIPSLFQKLFAREPDQRQLKAAEAALEVLTNKV
ncbi:MAG: DUF1385 domain-containing protein [Halanaerobiales bacterium]|nr:DUF1385 domain-containing protein [Halanaerobiales bacterium]